mmetsp:Transcript_24267/g.36210  ORF Transcript_24267/g.36210 Transcript_24267/m.36210 type:complete len:91 (-) Transcript_24267:353-625(-)
MKITEQTYTEYASPPSSTYSHPVSILKNAKYSSKIRNEVAKEPVHLRFAETPPSIQHHASVPNTVTKVRDEGWMTIQFSPIVTRKVANNI